MALVTFASSGITYAWHEPPAENATLVISDELHKLDTLYKEGIITEEEFKKAKSILLDPDSDKSKIKKIKKKKKKLTAVERKRLKEAKVKAEKELQSMENKAKREAIAEEKERIKAAKKEACLEVTEIIGLSDETPRGCQLIKLKHALKKN